MRKFILLTFYGLLLIPNITNSQQASQQISFAEQDREKVNILKASVAFHDGQESIFWPLYEQYEQKLDKIRENSFVALQHLTLNHSDSLALENVQHLLLEQNEEASIKREYFDKLNLSTNGILALQFLQSEALFDLLTKSKWYEKLPWERPKWNPGILKDEQLKISAFISLLDVNSEQAQEFKLLMEDFEFEYSRIVGHEFLFFEQYIEDPFDLTPGQCKTIGSSFVKMQLHEVKIKERYFEKMNKAFGTSFAARFIAMEEYFNIISKLNVWSNYLSSASNRR
jgi:hypothetical protein